MITENENLFDQLKTQAISQVLSTGEQSKSEVTSDTLTANVLHTLPKGQKVNSAPTKFRSFPLALQHEVTRSIILLYP